MKICPECAEQVQDDARVCRYCKYSFAEGRPGQDGQSSRGAGCAMIFIVIVVFMAISASFPGLFSKQTSASSPVPVAPLLSSAEKQRRLASCKQSMTVAKRIGFVRQHTGDKLVVDERQWDELDWSNKMILMDCVVVEKLHGDRGGDHDIVLVYGYRSGKQLAGGSPGAGTLAPY